MLLDIEAEMTYKDDLEKLRKEAGIDINDPAGYAPRGAVRSGAEGGASASDGSSENLSEPFTQEEKKMSLWQRFSLPFIRSAFQSVLFFGLVTLVWIAISHTVVATLHDMNRWTHVVFMIKDAIFMIVISVVM